MIRIGCIIGDVWSVFYDSVIAYVVLRKGFLKEKASLLFYRNKPKFKKIRLQKEHDQAIKPDHDNVIKKCSQSVRL